MTVGERKLRDRLLVLVGTLARDNCALGDPHEPVEVLVKIRFHLPAASLMLSALLGQSSRNRTTTGSASSLRSKSFLRLWSVDQRQLSPVYQPVGSRQIWTGK